MYVRTYLEMALEMVQGESRDPHEPHDGFRRGLCKSLGVHARGLNLEEEVIYHHKALRHVCAVPCRVYTTS
jgi:hypothetical protein